MKRLLRQAVACLTVASLLITAPGLGLYSALAAQMGEAAGDIPEGLPPRLPGSPIGPAGGVGISAQAAANWRRRLDAARALGGAGAVSQPAPPQSAQSAPAQAWRSLRASVAAGLVPPGQGGRQAAASPAAAAQSGASPEAASGLAARLFDHLKNLGGGLRRLVFDSEEEEPAEEVPAAEVPAAEVPAAEGRRSPALAPALAPASEPDPAQPEPAQPPAVAKPVGARHWLGAAGMTALSGAITWKFGAPKLAGWAAALIHAPAAAPAIAVALTALLTYSTAKQQFGALLERRRAHRLAEIREREGELAAVDWELEQAPRPAPNTAPHEIVGLALIVAAAAAGHALWSGPGAVGGFLLGAWFSDRWLSLRRDRFKEDRQKRDELLRRRKALGGSEAQEASPDGPVADALEPPLGGSPPRGPPAGLSPPGTEPSAASQGPRVFEDFFGFRWVRGRLHEPAAEPSSGRLETLTAGALILGSAFAGFAAFGLLGAAGGLVAGYALAFHRQARLARGSAREVLPLSATTEQVIRALARDGGWTRQRLLELMAPFGLGESSPLDAWLAVHDWLRVHGDREQFKRFDHEKSDHSWRELANVRYSEGRRGALERLAEVQKHSAGAFVRFPYHLFDLFVLGYFRQNMAYELFHSGEDFLGALQPGLREKYLLHAASQAVAARGFKRSLRAQPIYRALDRYLWTPWLGPLGQFLSRRLTLAVASAVAMGVLGGLAPVLTVFGLPLLSLSLTTIPLLGPALIAIVNALPVLVGWLPFCGHALAPVAAAAAQKLLADLVVGPMLNTLILSSFLTFPHAVRQRLAELDAADPARRRGLRSQELCAAALAVASSSAYWRANLKSFLAMMTVGAEIEGIMTYADVADQAASAVSGAHVTLFHALGSAVERPRGKSLIPFGGAITWGNVLLYKAQNWLGFNLSDAVAHGVSVFIGDRLPGVVHAQTLLAVAEGRYRGARGPKPAPFDKTLYRKSPGQVWRRLKDLASRGGDLESRIAQAKARAEAARRELASERKRFAALEASLPPSVTPAQRAELERLNARYASARDEDYARGKLAEDGDLAAAPDAARLARLRALKQSYADDLVARDGRRPAVSDALAARRAQLLALERSLSSVVEKGTVALPNGTAARLPDATVTQIAQLVKTIEDLRSQAKGEMANRDAESRLLGVLAQARHNALRERRNGRGMSDFHRNLARLDTVMSLALSLNEIAAAEQAIHQMMALLDAKIAKINAAAQQNQQNLAQAQQNQQQTQKWKDEANQVISADQSTQKTIVDYENRTALAAERVGSFQHDLSALIGVINARDGGQSRDALTEYARRLALLPQVADWRTNGNPNDSSAFSLKTFQDDLSQVDGYIQKVQDGIGQLRQTPLEAAGVAIILVPGPDVTIHNPTKEQTLQILADRKTYWQRQSQQYRDDLARINRMMDPGNTNTTTDEFGDSAPESLPRYLSQEQGIEQTARANVQQYAAQIDAAADQINSVAGSNLPHLSGLPLDQLESVITNYGNLARAVKLPDSGGNDAAYLASMNMLSLAKLIPYAADNVVQWAKADATITSINSAMATTLPQAKTRLTAIVQVFDDVLADDDADVAYVTHGGDPQALLNRKIDLLQNKVLPALQGADDLLRNVLIPYQRQSIAQVQVDASAPLYQLLTSQQTLAQSVSQLYNSDVAWALASFGGSKSDPAGSRASIAAWKKTIEQNLNGYDDAQGHHEGVNEYIVEVQHRKDPNYAGPETTDYLKDPNYPDGGPFSLPRKIALYSAERAQRVAQLNAQDAQINDILSHIETVSKGRYNLQSFRLPTDLTGDAAGASRAQALFDSNLIQNLGGELQQIAADNQSSGAGISVADQGSAGPPTGTQPPITASDAQTLSLLALDAAKRIVPSSLQQPQTAPASYALARLLYSNGTLSAAQDALTNQIPVAETVLAHAQAVLTAADDTSKDEAYVDSNGTSESADSVYARKVALFSSLNAFLQEGANFFNLKGQWDMASLNTVDQVSQYYGGLGTIYGGASSTTSGELQAATQMKAALQTTLDGLEQSRTKVKGWMSQLDDPHDSALARVSESVATLQDQTRKVLEANVQWQGVRDQLRRSDDIVAAKLGELDEAQQRLVRLLDRPDVSGGGLPPDLINRIEALRLAGGSWAWGGSDGSPEAIAVKKSDFGGFVESLLDALGARGSSENLPLLRQDLLSNPGGLSALLPDAKMLEFGGDDGFYLIYQSRFSVPNGLETGTDVTLGNAARLGGNNISVGGYQLASQPSDASAPYGDKGAWVQVESLRGKNWVNYLNVDLHRFIFDIPPDAKPISQLRESRLLVFDDFAMLLFGDRLYVGLAGFADRAVDQPGQHPSYYGGNLKTSIRLNGVMRLNAEQRELFANDPRKFLETVNLDFTGFDPDLNQTFAIQAHGDNKHYSRTQVGPSFDVGKLLGSKDAFTLDLYWAKTTGSDDIHQESLGVSILKGFTLADADGKPWAVIDNQANAELGQQYPAYRDRLSVTLPRQGIVVSGQGQILGPTSAYYGEISKSFGDHSTVRVGYGSRYVGIKDRLSLEMNTSFTLRQLYEAVLAHGRSQLKGGRQLSRFNTDIKNFFDSDRDGGGSGTRVEALRRVFDQDVGRKLLTQDIGTLRRDIDQLRGAGAFLDNTRVQGMIGFISNPVSSDQADVTVGGGPVAATQTELTLTRSQKALIQAKTQALFLDGLRLQQRLLELSRRWQEDVAQIARAQWDLKLASFMRQNAGTEALRRQAGVLAADASDRLHQALLDYNALSGRSPDAPVPFKDLSASDLRELTAAIRGTLSGGDRLKAILHELDPAQMKERLGPEAFNLLDWLPFLDRMTLSIGAQLQDSLANQAMTVGVSLRIPVYDPSSGHADKAYRLESRATIAQMAELQAERRLEADRQDAQARLSAGQAKAAQAGLPRAARALSLAIRAYRNGLIGEAELQQAFDTWRWYAREALDGEIESSLSAAWAASGRYLAGSTDDGNGDGSGNENGSLALGSLDEAFSQAESRSGSLAEVALREQAAAEMARDNAHRIQKVLLDLNIGTGLTASGDGWLPAVGLTGYPVMPIVRFEFKPEELRELQAEEGRGQTEYYRQLKAELEGELALELYQSVVAYQSASAAVSRYDDSLLPGLRERAEVEGQGSGGAAVKAQRRLDAALEKRAQAALARRQALATLNFLLGRRGDAPLQVGIDADQALAWLRAALSRENPVAARQRLLKARVQTAQAVETVVDKDLRAQQLALEPVSLVARSLGRLIDVLGGGKPGRPQLLAEARAQTLREQRALDAYPGQRRAAIAQAKAQLNLVRSRLESLSNGGDAAQRELLLGRERILLGALCALGADGQDAAPQSYSELPHSFDELGERLAQARQDMSARQPGSPVELLAPATQRQRPAGFARYYYAQQTLGKVAIDKSYVEGWLETRLRDYETDPKVLLRLAQLSGRKADELHRVEVAGSRAQGEMLAADFEAEARLLRWAETARGQEGADLRASLLKELEARRAEIVALLNLPPDTGLDSLLALVPAQSRGDGDPSALASGFSGQIRRLGLGELERSLFADGQLAGLGTDADLLSRLRAGLLAERMSYDGLTPVLAFGLFRGTPTGGAVLEVPDPRQIEHGLDNMLSEALRKDLESSGRLRELSLGLRALMAKVQDEEVEVERSARLVQAAEADYRAQMGLVGEGGDLAEAEAARSRLLKAWLGFSRRLSGARADFVELVTELEALNPGRRAGLRPLVHPLRAQPPTLRSDPRRRLLSYWTDRMLDADFRADLSRRLDLIAARASPAQGKALSQLRRRLEEDAGLYSTADRDAAAVLAKDFSDAERLDLLSRNDREGKREALSFDLGRLLEACGGLSQRDDPLVAFLVRDIDAQARRAAAARDDFAALDGALRQAAWSADDPARGIFQRLEAARQTMETARQALWADDDGLEENATRVLLKDSRLDDFLKAQQRYDAEVVGTFQSEAVRRDRSLAWRLDAFFDLDAALDRQIDAARGGRGMLAMDALIALERSRLLAARWEGRPPGELDALAANLQALRDRRQAWRSGASDVEPLYAVTRIERDGRRLWSVEGWMTRREFEAERAAGRVKSVDGRMIWSGGAAPRELIGGIDAARADLDSARSAARDNGAVLSRQGLLERYDYVPDRPLRGDRAPAREGLSVEDLFGAAGLGRQGRLLFFKAPKPGEPAGSEHQALDPIAALSLSPDDYVVYAYDGGKPLDKGAFPSLESLKDSERRSDFARLTLSPSGARDLGARLERQRQAELEAGWVDVKLDGYGFARDAKGDVVQIYLTRDDFRAQRKAFANAARDLEALRAASRRAQEREQRAKGELEARRAALEHARPAYEAARARRSSDKAGFDSAQAAFDALSKASSRAQADYEAANAAAQNARRAVTEEKSTLARSKAWSLYRSRDLSLSLDADGTIVAAAAQPVYGAQTLSQPVASGGPVARVLSGELLAAALDSQGRLVGYYQDPEALAADARRWKLVTVSLGAGSELPAAARTVDPRARLDHYELPLPGGGSAPIALNRRYLIAQVQDARAKLHAADHYAVLPWHWGDLLLELPRGVAGAPLELLGGRDPRQQHYLGRAAMYRTEGGSTERQGFFRRAAGLIDILDFLPDPVERFFDPSQFPDHVAVDSPLLPGQSVFDKGMRTLDGRKDIHFGATALRRELSYSLEDLAAEQRRALEHFHGGEETLLVSSWRGRSGLYQDSTRSGAAGPQALRSALNEPSFSAELPDSLAVEGLRRVVRPRLGADELAQEEAALKGYPEAFLRRLGLRRSRQAGLEQRSARAQATLKRAQAARRGAHARAEALWSRREALAERVSAYDAARTRLERSRARQAELARSLAFWRHELARLNARAQGLRPAGPRRDFPAKASPLAAPSAAPAAPARLPAPAPATHGEKPAPASRSLPWGLGLAGAILTAALLWWKRRWALRPSHS